MLSPNATVYEMLQDCLKQTKPRVRNFTNGELMIAKLELLRLVSVVNEEQALRLS